MFFERVTELCQRKGISLSTAAREIGLSNSAITYWKRGAVPKASTVQKLADYFGVTVDYLLGNTESSLIFRSSHTAPIAFDEKKIMEVAGIDPLDELDVEFIGDYQKLSEEEKKTVREIARFVLQRDAERQKKEPPQD